MNLLKLYIELMQEVRRKVMRTLGAAGDIVDAKDVVVVEEAVDVKEIVTAKRVVSMRGVAVKWMLVNGLAVRETGSL